MKKSKIPLSRLRLKKEEIAVLCAHVSGGAPNSVQITGCGGSNFCTRLGTCAPEPPTIPSSTYSDYIHCACV